MEEQKSDLKMTKYTGKYTYGINDLKSPDPYLHGDGQWPYFESAFKEITEEQYNKDPKGYEEKVRLWNEEHIKELKEKGLYLTPYYIELDLIHNPLFDDSKISTSGLESHRMIFMDFQNDESVKKQRSKVTLKEDEQNKI